MESVFRYTLLADFTIHIQHLSFCLAEPHLNLRGASAFTATRNARLFWRVYISREAGARAVWAALFVHAQLFRIGSCSDKRVFVTGGQRGGHGPASREVDAMLAF